VLREDGQLGWMGYQIDKRRPSPGRGIPLALGRTRPRCFLHVMHTLVREHSVLITDQSTVGLYLDEELQRNIFHYDYDRSPDNPYARAHFQVKGVSDTFNELSERLDRPGELERLHFPVGGKRFRPCLEDVVEMLIVEGLRRAARVGRRLLRSTVRGFTAFNSKRRCATTRMRPGKSFSGLRKKSRDGETIA
jgi:hypothetical protein